MSGSTFGKRFCVTTFGESHGAALGVVIDGMPAGIALTEEMLAADLSRRRPGQSAFTTARREADVPRILSGVYEGVTTGTSIAVTIENTDAHSSDYSRLASVFRPGHADFGFQAKFGLRDPRGGGRSSGRETAARVIAGAAARQLLARFGIAVRAWTESIGPVSIDPACLCGPGEDLYLRGISEAAWEAAKQSPVGMPDPDASKRVQEYLQQVRADGDSAGGVIRCTACGVPAGLGDPVFDKLDARLAAALFSIGGVKAVAVGDGFDAARAAGSENNDAFFCETPGNPAPAGFDPARVRKKTNHAGGILGGISDGSPIMLAAAVKPTPSIARPQQTVNLQMQSEELAVTGRHDPVIVPRAVVVVEAMTAVTLADALLSHSADRIDLLERAYRTGGEYTGKP